MHSMVLKKYYSNEVALQEAQGFRCQTEQSRLLPVGQHQNLHHEGVTYTCNMILKDRR